MKLYLIDLGIQFGKDNFWPGKKNHDSRWIYEIITKIHAGGAAGKTKCRIYYMAKLDKVKNAFTK